MKGQCRSDKQAVAQTYKVVEASKAQILAISGQRGRPSIHAKGNGESEVSRQRTGSSL